MEPEYCSRPEDFLPYAWPREESSPIARPSLGFWRETWMYLRRDAVAVTCLMFLALIILGAIFFPLWSSFAYDAQNVAFSNRPPFSPDPVSGAIHLFGTDHLGRDIFVRVWYGVRVSLGVSAIVAVLDCVLGVIYGGLSGYLGGRKDGMMMRLLEIIGGIPYLVVVLLLAAVLPRGLGTLIIAYSLVGWVGMARLARGQVVGLKQQDFIVAARIMGAGPMRILFRHLLPNLLGIVVTSITLDIPAIIFTEAFLSMLGLGVPPPYPSLGVMLKEATTVFQVYPSQLAIPSVLICLLLLSFYLLGDRLQDAIDPKRRRTVTRERRAGH